MVKKEVNEWFLKADKGKGGKGDRLLLGKGGKRGKRGQATFKESILCRGLKED